MLFSCSPYVGLTLESMSSTMPRGGLRPCTRSIHWPDRSARAAKFLGAASHCVSKRPIWLGEAALLCAALPPTIHRIAGSCAGARRRSHPRIRQGDRIPTAGTTRPMRDLVAVDVEIDRWIVGRERAEHPCQLRILVKGRCMVPARSPAHALS